jgi:hypothetical protein
MSYVLKYRLVLAFSFLLVVSAYLLAVKKTAQEIRMYKNAKLSIQAIEQAPVLLKEYQKELTQLKTLIGEHSGDYKKVDGVFFGLLSQLAEKYKVQIASVEKPIEAKYEHYKIKTYPVTLQGEFVQVLAMVEELESDSRLGKLVSLGFSVKKSKNSKKVLISTLYYKIVSSDEK